MEPSDTNIQPLEYSRELTIAMNVISIIISVIICFANILTIVAICKFKNLKSGTNYLILSLSFADLSLGVILPVCAGLYLIKATSSGECKVCFLLKSISPCVSLTTIVAIALERFYAIVFPLHHKRNMSKKKVMFAIGVIWIYLSSLLASSILPNSNFSCYKPAMSKWLYIAFPIHVAIYMMICAVVYTKMYYAAVDHAKRVHSLRFGIRITKIKDSDESSVSITTISTGISIHGDESNNEATVDTILGSESCQANVNEHVPHGNNHTNQRVRRKSDWSKIKKEINSCEKCRNILIGRMTFLVLIVVILFWLPFCVMMVLVVLLGNEPSSTRNLLFDISTHILYSNSFVNPILYSWQNDNFRKAFKTLLFRSVSETFRIKCHESHPSTM